MFRKIAILACGAAAGLSFAGAASAQDYYPIDASVVRRAGTLSCQTSGGVNLIFGSTQTVACQFVGKGSRRRPPIVESYAGSADQFGLSVGFSGPSAQTYAVYTRPGRTLPGQVAGSYQRGANISAAIIDTNALAPKSTLIGGVNKSVALKTISSTDGAGLNIGVSASEMNLAPVVSAGPVVARY